MATEEFNVGNWDEGEEQRYHLQSVYVGNGCIFLLLIVLIRFL